MSEHSPAILAIDVVSDVVCPWCYIGKRQLETAVARWQAQNPRQPAPAIRWRPFQLNPDMPAGGMARSDYLLKKFGSPDGGGMYARVQAAARQVGLDLAFDSIKVQPNTLKAHALIELATEAGVQDQLVEAFFAAYFHDGRDLSDDATLREIAAGAGLSEDLIETVLVEESVVKLVAAADAEVREYGIGGVPFMIVGGAGGQRVAVSGAQGADSMLAAFGEVSP